MILCVVSLRSPAGTRIDRDETIVMKALAIKVQMAMITFQPVLNPKEVNKKDNKGNVLYQDKDKKIAEKEVLNLVECRVKILGEYNLTDKEFETDGFNLEAFCEMVEMRGNTVMINGEYGDNDAREGCYQRNGEDAVIEIHHIYKNMKRRYQLIDSHVQSIYQSAKLTDIGLRQIEKRRQQKRTDKLKAA